MIIKILESVDFTSDRDAKISAVENLLKAHAEGKHRLWMPISVIRELSKFDGLGSFSLRVLDELMGQSVEEKDLHKEFLFFARVDFFDKYILSFNLGVLSAGYQHFSDSAGTQEIVLLTENNLDGDAYFWGAKTYLNSKKIRLGLSIDIQSGGGNTTYDRFSRLDRGKRFFACIVDSDKDHPKAALGTTAKRFAGVSLGFQGRRYFEVLPCHEIENILPFAIVREVAKDKINGEFVFDQKFLEYRSFVDHKAGVTIGQARLIDKLHGGRYFSVFDDVEEDFGLCPKFGVGLLESCIEFMDSLSVKNAIKYVDESLDKDWVRLSKVVASWGVGGRGLRS